MEQLEEGVLRIVTGLTPDDGRGLTFHGTAIEHHGFAVALHLELLQVGGETSQRVVIRQHGERRRFHEIDIPDADEPHERRQVVAPWRSAKMLIDLVAAAEEVEEVLRTRGDRE